MDHKHTPGPWSVNHWSKGPSGIQCHGKERGITYYSGDAVIGKHFGIRSQLKHDEYSICGSFEGAHICDIEDSYMDARHLEAQANAKLIAAAPELLDVLKEVRRHGLIEQDGYDALVRKVNEVIKATS